ncbi:MAG: 3'(2'),5'-bisphosphate nucleotidase CysQ, partial [Parvibaculaceae bacterium]
MSPSALTRELVAIALAAGHAVMDVYARKPEARLKQDNSPVTEADVASERIILAGLKRVAPDTPVVSEEEATASDIPLVGERFFLVDPLDGTKEFLSGNGEFTINIALIEGGEPVLGVVHAPAKGRLFWGEQGLGAGHAQLPDDAHVDAIAWQRLSARACPEDGAIVVASRSHRDIATDSWLASR